MKIIVNRVDDFLNGFIGNTPFSILYTKEAYAKLIELSEQLNVVETGKEAKVIIEEATNYVNGVSEDTIVATSCPYLYVDKTNNKYYLKNKDIISKIAIPQVLVDRILYSMDKGIDYMPVIKMWTRFLRNPKMKNGNAEFAKRFANYVNIKVVNDSLREKLISEKGYSLDRAIEAAKQYSIQITKEGMLLTYKVSRELLTKFELDEYNQVKEVERFPKKIAKVDENSGLIIYEEPESIAAESRVFEPPVMGKGGDAFYCGVAENKGERGHIIKVGHIISLPDWSYVNINDNQSCVKGLHVGGIDYIKGYQNNNTQTHNIVVDPMDIGAICDDNTGAMRVLRYYVLDVFNGINNSIYHSSTYAEFTDAEFAYYLGETLKKEVENQRKALDKMYDEGNALIDLAD